MTAIEWILKGFEDTINDDMASNVRYQLTDENLQDIINSLDTEYDQNALKAVVFATRSRRDVEALGIKADRAVNFLHNTINAAQEWKNSLIEAEDMVDLQLKEQKEVLEKEKNKIDEKIVKLGDFLPQSSREDLDTKKQVLEERLAGVACLQEREDETSMKSFQQRKRRLAVQLVEKNRVKRRKLSSGAPRLLDSEDESFIQKSIEDKGTAHGRRHTTTLYANHRVKKKDFLTIANYNLHKRGKKLIKSATTVLNRKCPRNKASRAAKAHIGKWLFCAKKPPKTEREANECTHHQRKHVKNAKISIFQKGRENHGLVLSMEDKAYLRPGTDVGMRNVKSGRIYDVVDEEKQKKLPEHDFSYPKFHITPSSFRFMTAHQEVINGKTHIVNDVVQTVVVNRPKHYIGSSGSVWGSDIMNLRWELPHATIWN